jgi:antitoxin component YwqK of YwqJK toxin-antitoxin module
MSLSSLSLIQIFDNNKEKILLLEVIPTTFEVKAKVIKFYVEMFSDDDSSNYIPYSSNPYICFKVGHTYTILNWDKTRTRFTGTIIKDWEIDENNNYSSFKIEFKNGRFHGSYRVDCLKGDDKIESNCYFYNGMCHRYIKENRSRGGVTQEYTIMEFKKSYQHGKTEKFLLKNGFFFKSISFFKNGLLHGVDKFWDMDCQYFCYSPYKNNKRHGLHIRLSLCSDFSEKIFYKHDEEITTVNTYFKNREGFFNKKNKIKIY